MKRLLTATLTILATISLKGQITFGEKTLINDNWTFSLDGGAAETVNLPHDWSIKGKPSSELASCTGYLPGGVGVYEKSLYIGKEQSGRKQFLYFDGIYCNAEIFVNGERVGGRPNGYLPIVCDISSSVNYGKENIVRVTVDHSKYADSRYYTGSGISRNVWLVNCGKIHIDNWGVQVTTPEISDNEATVRVWTKILNESKHDETVTVRQAIFQKDNYDILADVRTKIKIPKGGSIENVHDLKLTEPKLWSPDKPKLYRVQTYIYKDGVLIDGCSTITGIRKIEFTPDKGMFLNGKPILIKGVCLHHEAGSLGAAIPEGIIRERLSTLKSLGCNAVRMSHNPQSETIYDLCDELGFMVMDEAFDEWMSPKRKWVEGWNVGKHPSLDGYAEHFGQWAERDVTDMVLRGRNHPSIIMWSIGNEIDYPNDPFTHPVLDYEDINQRTTPGFKPERRRAEELGPVAKKLAAAVRNADSTRAVTAALAGVVMSNYTDYPYALDVVGYNYTEHRYEKDHAKYPKRIIYGSENRHSYPAWKAVIDNEFILGQFLWTGIDYLGEASEYPSRGSKSGLIDLAGNVKPRGRYRQSLWSSKPCVTAGTKPTSQVGDNPTAMDWESEWNYTKGDSVWIAANGNCGEMRLSINGKVVESEPVWFENSNSYAWKVAFVEGEVTVEGLNSGKKVAQYSFGTCTEPAGIEVKAWKHQLLGCGDAVSVRARIVDTNGRTVRNSPLNIRCDVEGDAELLCMENADLTYSGAHPFNEIPAHNGIATAYIKSTSPSGKAVVRMSCGDWTGTEELSIMNSEVPYILDTCTAYGEIYRNDPDLKIYFMYPERDLKRGEKLPTMVFYFGGGWVNGSIEAFAGQGKELTRHGMAVALVDYRVWKRNGTNPFACIEDAKSAMRYIRANADRLHIDPERICTSGGSAGGHLAAAVAFCPGFDAPGDDLSISTIPNAMVLFNPVFNNAEKPEGYGYERIKSRFPDFSPAHNIKSPVPPTLVMLGTEDALIPQSTAIDFMEKMKRAGGRCETVFYEGAGHGFFNWNNSISKINSDQDSPLYYRITLDNCIEFLRSLDWIE